MIYLSTDVWWYICLHTSCGRFVSGRPVVCLSPDVGGQVGHVVGAVAETSA